MMSVPSTDVTLHPFLKGLPSGFAARLAAYATPASVPAGHRFFEEGGEADRFWLITHGHVALDVHLPGRDRLIIETLGAGELMGLSWLSPPPQLWQFGAEALELTDVFEFDSGAVSVLCDSHPELGYRITLRLLAVLTNRLHATRLRLMDLYSVTTTLEAGAPPAQRPSARTPSSRSTVTSA